MDLFGNLKKSISTLGVVAVGAIGMFACGAVMAFFLSPQAAVEWRHIQSLPELDASSFQALKAGDEAAITGVLQNNDTLIPEGLVAYEKDMWQVSEPSSSSNDDGTPSKPTGRWENMETKIPDLTVAISGGTISTAQVGTANFSGAMHTSINKSKSNLTAEYDNSPLPDESIRIQGFANDDTVTIVGRISTSGALIPNRIFGGDRVQLVDEIHTQAQTLFGIGIGMMICSPIVLVVGILGVIFGRRRGLFGG